MSKYQFKVGDHVRIRQWEDMKKEFGLDSDGDIPCKQYYPHEVFTNAMRDLCGREVVITKISPDSGIFSLNGVPDRWCYCSEMLEPLEFTIVIRTKCNVTTAYQKQGKKTLKTATAKCSPDDTFDLYTGAQIALARLFDKPVPDAEEKPKFKFAVGDKVKVIDAGKAYTTDYKFVEDNASDFVKAFKFLCDPSLTHTFTVIAHKVHPDFPREKVYIILDAEFQQVYVINEKGLESAE